MTDHQNSSAGNATDRREAIEAEIAYLRAKNEAATSWGAAVGARSERIKGLERALRAMDNQTCAPAHGTESDPFRRAEVEAICRAVCKVEGVDPDDDTFGDGCDPVWTRYADAVFAALVPTPAQPSQVSEALQLADECEREFEYSRHRMVRVAKILRALAAQPPATPVEFDSLSGARKQAMESHASMVPAAPVEREIMEATEAQHSIPRQEGRPAQFTHNGKLRICQCSDCRRWFLRSLAESATPFVSYWEDVEQRTNVRHETERCDEPQSLSAAMERALSQYDKTIDAAKSDLALSDTGRNRIIEDCIAAKGAIKNFVKNLELTSALSLPYKRNGLDGY